MLGQIKWWEIWYCCFKYVRCDNKLKNKMYEMNPMHATRLCVNTPAFPQLATPSLRNRYSQNTQHPTFPILHEPATTAACWKKKICMNAMHYHSSTITLFWCRHSSSRYGRCSVQDVRHTCTLAVHSQWPFWYTHQCHYNGFIQTKSIDDVNVK